MKAGLGKLDGRTMKRFVFRNLGKSSEKVILGPGIGLDNAVIAAGGKTVLIVTTDPVSIIPSIGARASAWMSVHLIASDFTTSGVGPEFASFDFNFPPELSAQDQIVFLRETSRACKEIGVSIVAGHTGSYPGGGFTVIGGGTMFGFAARGKYVDPTMARDGDLVVMTKGAGIEAATSLANSFPEKTEDLVGRKLCNEARALVGRCSTVKDALAAADIGLGGGRVTSMHDATEGGVLRGLAEMASASRHSIVISEHRIPRLKEASAVCTAFGIDPLSSLSEGTLLITVGPERATDLVNRLEKEGIGAAMIGKVAKGAGLWRSEGVRGLKKIRLRPDPYWEVFARESGSKAGFTGG